MSEKGPLDSQIFYSANIAPKFRAILDKSNLSSLSRAGLGEMFRDGVALNLIELEEPYAVVIFPKNSPSRPFEMMMTVLPLQEGIPAKSSLREFTDKDALQILRSSEKILKALKDVTVARGHEANDGYVFQHFNPYDLTPKTMFNGSVAHLHLHIQMYGHSLNEFPETFVPSGKIKSFEGANRLLRDSGVSIFYELMSRFYPELHISCENSGCIGFGNVDISSNISSAEIGILKRILQTWDEVWKECASCYGEAKTEQEGNRVLFPAQKRIENVKKMLEKYSLSRKNQEIFLFLAENIQDSSDDIWRNFYHGPNGSLGLHIDYKNKSRKWLIAPRIFRSWARHMPLVSVQKSPVAEWTTKNEAGDGLVNNDAQDQIFPMQRQVIEALKGVV